MDLTGGVPGKYAAIRAKKERVKQKNALKRQMAQLGYQVPKKSSDSDLNSITDLFGKVKLKAMRTKKPDVDPKNIVTTKRASMKPTKEVKMTDVKSKPSRVSKVSKVSSQSSKPTSTPSSSKYIYDMKMSILSNYSDEIQKQVKSKLMDHKFRFSGDTQDLSRKIVDKITKVLNDRIKGIVQARMERLYPTILQEDNTIVKYSSLPLNKPETRSIDVIMNYFIEDIKHNHAYNRRIGKTQKQVIENMYNKKQFTKKTDELAAMFARM